jgi:hypothetical protein
MPLRCCFNVAFLFAFLLLAPTISPLHGQVRTGSASPDPRAFLPTSLCEALAHPARFDRKTVRFRAKYGGTWEGRWLSDDHCDGVGELVLPGYSELAERYGISKLAERTEDLVRDSAWQYFDSSSRRLYTGMSVTRADGTIDQGDYDYLTADFTGVLVVKRNFHFKNGFGNGWGHLGASRFLLILRSVHDVSAHPCACPPRDLPPPVVQFQPSPPPEVFMPAQRQW